MKKLIILLTAILMANTGLKAEIMNGVKYLDANGVEQTVDAIVVTDADEPVIWGTAGKTTWYVCAGAILSKGAICQGDVHLIICQGLLTATGITDDTNNIYTPGIQVSGEGNSLTIYGQTISKGQNLHATGGKRAAGIGGGEGGSGSNITINGGTVMATGTFGAGIGGGVGVGGDGFNITINGGFVKATSKYGAAIGGGQFCSGSNITINDGEVTATGEEGGAGIGGGEGGSGSNITINGCRTVTATSYYGAGIGGGVKGSGSDITIKGGTVTAYSARGSGIGGGDSSSGSNNITMPVNYRIKVNEVFIHNDGTDLADLLAGKKNVTAYPDKYLNERNTAFATINAAIEGITNENILAMAATGITGVFNAEEVADINGIKEKTLADLQNVITIYNAGKADGYERGKADALGSLGTKQNGPAVILTDKDDNEIILYSPKSVEYIKVKEE